jgi:hypothetical protein
MHRHRVVSASLLALCIVPAQGQSLPAAMPVGVPSSTASAAAAISGASVSHAAGQRSYQLPRRIAVHGVPACPNAQTIRIRLGAANDRHGEPALVDHALRTGAPIQVADATCGADGVIVGSAISLVPAAGTVTDNCRLAYARGRAPGCPS